MENSLLQEIIREPQEMVEQELLPQLSSNTETYDIRVPIKLELKHKQPFGAKLPSNIINSIVLSYLGRKVQIIKLLQILNHNGRAFCVYKNGLKGFLIEKYPVNFANFTEDAQKLIQQLDRDRADRKLQEGKKLYNFVQIRDIVIVRIEVRVIKFTFCLSTINRYESNTIVTGQIAI